MIGSSTDAREPHVHLEIAHASVKLTGEGLPYIIDSDTVVQNKTRAIGARMGQLPPLMAWSSISANKNTSLGSVEPVISRCRTNFCFDKAFAPQIQYRSRENPYYFYHNS